MDSQFWHDKWNSNQIAFHQAEANPLLVEYLDVLKLNPGDTVFVPLCGKTLDIAWLLSQGYKVIGVELVELAVQQLFEELDVRPQITQLAKLKRYQFENIIIFVGDIFDLTAELLGDVDAVYDRAAFVALPPDMRVAYSRHINQNCQHAPQLLINYEYDQTVMAGPPFASTPQDIADHYGNTYQIDCLLSQQLADGLKGEPAKEYVWHMHTS
jgi:thiopurine S-methyltransferase